MNLITGFYPGMLFGQIVDDAKDAFGSGVSKLMKVFTPFGGHGHAQEVKQRPKGDRAEIAKVQELIERLDWAQEHSQGLRKQLVGARNHFTSQDVAFSEATEEYDLVSESLGGRLLVLKGELRAAKGLEEKKENLDNGYSKLIAEKRIRLAKANAKAGFFNSFFARIGWSVDYRKEGYRLEKEITSLDRSRLHKYAKITAEQLEKGLFERKINAKIQEVSTALAEAECVYKQAWEQREEAANVVSLLEAQLEQVDALARGMLDELNIPLDDLNGDEMGQSMQRELQHAKQAAEHKLESLEGRI